MVHVEHITNCDSIALNGPQQKEGGGTGQVYQANAWRWRVTRHSDNFRTRGKRIISGSPHLRRNTAVPTRQKRCQLRSSTIGHREEAKLLTLLSRISTVQASNCGVWQGIQRNFSRRSTSSHDQQHDTVMMIDPHIPDATPLSRGWGGGGESCFD